MTDLHVRTAEVDGVAISWDRARGTLTVLEQPAVTFWLDPSLRHLLGPLIAEVGAPLYRLLIAYQGSLGAEADYRYMTIAGDLDSGFRLWSDAVATSGWGRYTLESFSPGDARARVRGVAPWELRLQRERAPADRWGCPFVQGKLIGLFTHAFGTTCWAEEEIADDLESVEFVIHASRRTIVDELAALRAERDAATQREIAALLDARTRELGETRARLEDLVARQELEIRRMSTPILQVGPNTLAVPIIGVVDAQRAGEITEQLLHAVAQRRARRVVLDLTGVDDVDNPTAERFARIARAVRLLGAECVTCGIQARVAEQLIRSGVDPGGARFFADMQAALVGLAR